jgi:hypothetical protein
MGSRNSLQGNSEFSQVEIIELSDEFASAISLDNPRTSTESWDSQTITTAQPSDIIDRSVKDDPNISSPSHASSNTTIRDSQEKSEDLPKKKEKLQVKFPFAFISEENIPHISTVVRNGNVITFTMNLKASSGSESDPAQPSPSVTLENLDSTISCEDLALLPTKIFPPLLGWKGIPCETLRLNNLPIDKPLLKAIVTSGIRRHHILNCKVAPRCSLDFRYMKALEELNISLPDFDDWISTPASLKTLIVHCPKSTVDQSKERLKTIILGINGWDSDSLEHV